MSTIECRCDGYPCRHTAWKLTEVSEDSNRIRLKWSHGANSHQEFINQRLKKVTGQHRRRFLELVSTALVAFPKQRKQIVKEEPAQILRWLMSLEFAV